MAKEVNPFKLEEIFLRKQLYRYRNGQIVELMENQGIRYAVNYGLRYAEILSIAEVMPRNQAFSSHLFKSEIREFKMISHLLEEFDKESEHDILEKCKAFQYQEQAEFVARHAYAEYPQAWNLCQLLLQENTGYARMTGNLLLARLSHSQAFGYPENNQFSELLIRQSDQMESFDRSLAIAATALAKLDEHARHKIIQWVGQMRTRSERHLLLLAYEIELGL
ncbi:MAG: hypothetical protein K9I34_03670 [Bacteroidales bacterium]|nr:hypothetical protein [Bacteroidales bacterium]